MAERKKKAADQAATPTTASKRGRKPKTAEVKTEPVEKPVEVMPEKSIYKVVCNSVLNVRCGAGKQFAVVRQIPNETEIEVLEQADGWGRIGLDEWVMMQFLK